MEKEAIFELYLRTHWLIIADLQREIATNEKNISSEQNTSDKSFLEDQIGNCVKILRSQIQSYQDQYEVVMREQNVALANRFLDNVRRTRSGNPEFAFLFSDKK